MDFEPSEEHRELAALSARILTDRVTNQRLREIEGGAERFDPELWQELGKADVLGAALPAPEGGGLGLVEQCGVLVEIGRAVAPVPYLPSITAGASVLAEFGGTDHRRRWVAPAARGEVVLTAALAEPSADPRAPITRAERAGSDWVLTGEKTNVPVIGVVDLLLVPAMTARGPRVFPVEPRSPGLRISRQEVVDSDSEGHLELTGVKVPEAEVLGAGALEELLRRSAIGVCAHQVGVLSDALRRTAEHAAERVQFGRAIGSFQAVAQRLADAFIDVQAAQLTMWQAAWSAGEGLPCDTEVATAKFWAAEAGHRVAHTAVHVHGGVGLDLDHELHRYFVAAKRNEFALGGATTWLRRVGARLAAK
ncbi:acyl-CoA dehydrogenase family protein [Saccharopolyspora griseoalba]|uniref:Acyl-CoA dehydrogenase family protein n=1 Tax=Saccharopolyspora griseoalba TaxID=1431848 RepID=A0ABW2LS15_9PSEU